MENQSENADTASCEPQNKVRLHLLNDDFLFTVMSIYSIAFFAFVMYL